MSAQDERDDRRFRSACSQLGWRGITLSKQQDADGKVRYFAHRPEVRHVLSNLDEVERVVTAVKAGGR